MNCKRKSALTTKVGGGSTPSSAMASSLQLLSRWTFSLFFPLILRFFGIDLSSLDSSPIIAWLKSLTQLRADNFALV